jgi:hypothetical protein
MVRSGRPTEQTGTLFDVETLFSNGAAPRGRAGEQEDTVRSRYSRVPTFGFQPSGINLRVQTSPARPSQRTATDLRDQGRKRRGTRAEGECGQAETERSRQDEPARERSTGAASAAPTQRTGVVQLDPTPRGTGSGAPRDDRPRVWTLEALQAHRSSITPRAPCCEHCGLVSGRTCFPREGQPPTRNRHLRVTDPRRVRDASLLVSHRLGPLRQAKAACTGTSVAFMATERGSHSVAGPSGQRPAGVLK